MKIVQSLALLLALFFLVSGEEFVNNKCETHKALLDTAAELCSAECQEIERSKCLDTLTTLRQNQECECDKQCEQLITDSYENLVSCEEEEEEENDDEMEFEEEEEVGSIEEDNIEEEEDNLEEEDEDEIEEDEDEVEVGDEEDLDELGAKKKKSGKKKKNGKKKNSGKKKKKGTKNKKGKKKSKSKSSSSTSSQAPAPAPAPASSSGGGGSGSGSSVIQSFIAVATPILLAAHYLIM